VKSYTFVTLFFQGLSKTTKMSLWRSNGKRQKCRFGAERVKEIEHQRSRAPNFVLQYLYFGHFCRLPLERQSDIFVVLDRP
jgi:hypothetical protein